MTVYIYDEFIRHLDNFKDLKLPVNFLNNDALSYKHWKSINNTEVAEISKKINLILNKLNKHNVQSTFVTLTDYINNESIKVFIKQFHKNIKCNNEKNIINYIKLINLFKKDYLKTVNDYFESLFNKNVSKDEYLNNIYICCILSKDSDDFFDKINNLIINNFDNIDTSEENQKKELSCDILLKIFNTLKNEDKYKDRIQYIIKNKTHKSRIKFLLMDFV